MDSIENIFSRRSIRKYTKDSVSEELVHKLLKAGMSAPSAGNQQPWHFIVIRDPATLGQVAKSHPYAGMAAEAALAILVCGDEKLERHKGYWVQDCSAATENILLAACASGLGAVWVGVFPNQDRVAALQKICSLPSHILPLALIPVGHPAETKNTPERYDGTRVHLNKW